MPGQLSFAIFASASMSDGESKDIPISTDEKAKEIPESSKDIIEKIDSKVVEPITMNTTSEDSEYETLEEDNGSSRSSGSRRSSFSGDLSDDIAIENEREDGDGQEENSVGKDKKLDDDEDKRNPQYIPKKGTFYEHDDRTMVDENDIESKDIEPSKKDAVEAAAEAAGAATKKSGGKVWTEKAEKWSHDLYNEDEQKPKSTQELIDTYGYDIRNEEAPPKARRRRRYGRGPNKYTRNWEDEEAYTRAAPQRRVFQNNKEEFPDLGTRGRNKDKGHPRSNSGDSKSKSKSPSTRQSPGQSSKPQGGDRDRPIDRSRGEKVRRDRNERIDKGERNERSERVIRGERIEKSERIDRGERIERGRGVKESPPSNTTNNLQKSPLIVAEKAVNERDGERRGPSEREGERRVGRGRGFRGTSKPRPTMEFTASRGRGPLPPAFNREPVNNQVDENLKHAAEMLVQDFSHIYLSNNSNNNNTNIVEETIVPRSERRSYGKDVDSGAGGDGGGGRSKRYSTQRQRSLPETTPPPAYSPPHSMPYYTQPPPTSYVPAPVFNDVGGAQVPMMAFLPPGPPPAAPAAPPYPPPPLMNYMPPPAFPPLTMQPPQISGQFEDPCGAELYQAQGGITYYSPQSQSVVPRPNPPRRVKLAIPIVPPPDNKQPQVGAKQQRGSSNGGAESSTQEIQSVAT